MNPTKMIELQNQMRHNQVELGDYLKDLDSWTSDIKTKDERLQKQDPVPVKQELPPVRNSLEKKKKRKKQKKKPADITQKSTRLSGYDFKAWDKFDVDEACENIDASEEAEEDLSEYETDEEWEDLRKKQQASMLKDQGNQWFKEGKYEEALQCYTKGLGCDPINAVLCANRAMALLKQEKYGAAELDCSAAISLDPSYVKAYHRRGTARLALKKLKEAKEDFQKVLVLDSGNKTATAELEKLEKLMNPPKFSMPVDTTTGIVKAIYKPPDQRSKKPLRRLVIEEIGDDENSNKKKFVYSDPVKEKVMQKEAAGFEKFLEEKASTEVEQSSVDVEKKSHQAVKHNSDVIHTKKSSTLTKGNEKEDVKKCSSLQEKHGESTQNVTANTKPSSQERQKEDKTKRKHTSCNVPATSFQFQKDWQFLKNTKEDFFNYFKEINPATYRQLFGEAMDSEILMKIMTTLHDFYIPNKLNIFDVLKHLCYVKRLDMATMFLSAKDKQGLETLFTHLDSTEEVTEMKRTYLGH